MTGLPIQSFDFQPSRLRVVMRDSEPWFVAADVCDALGLDNNRQAMTRLDDDEKGVISNDTPGGKQDVTIINESGLYSLIMGSRKPEAKKFRKWVTSEVLPAIRRTGRYEVPAPVVVAQAPALPDTRLMVALEAAVAEIGKLKDLLIGGQSQHIKTLNKLHTLQRRLDSRQACNTVIEMARRGETRERIEMATGLKKNYIRQLIFRAKRSGALPKDETTTQSAFGFEFSQQQYQGARHA